MLKFNEGESSVSKMKDYFKHLYLPCVHMTLSGAKGMKTALFATIACASLLPIYSPNVVAQQVAGPQSKSIGSAEQAHKEALKLYRSGEIVKAAQVLAPYAKQPENVLIIGDYLAFLIWSGDSLKAISAYEKLPADFPKSPYLLRNMAKAYYDQGSYAQATSLYADTLKQTPLDEEAQKGHVLSLHQDGKTKEANAKLDDYLKASPSSIRLQSIRPQILLGGGDYAKALAIQSDLLRSKGVSSTEQHRAWESLLASVPADKNIAMMKALKEGASSGEVAKVESYIVVLALQRDFPAVISTYASAAIKPESLSTYATYWVGWSYFKLDNLKQSEVLYQNALSREPKDIYATMGLAYVLGKQKKAAEAFKLLDQLTPEVYQMAEIRFVRAYIYEQQNDYWSAIKEYDAILAVYASHPAAKKLKLMAMSALGASSQVLRAAGEDSELQTYIQGNMAINRMQWGELRLSLAQIDPLLKRKEGADSRFDRIFVLVEDQQMKEAISEYENLKAAGVSLPAWTLEEVGSAYVYLEEWEKALDVYGQVLKVNPESFDARIGKFYSFSELRRWDEAEAILVELERDVIPSSGRSSYTADQQLEVVLTRGWFLLERNMLREADAYFTDYYNRAPASTGVRSGLAHTHYYRGWPRQAMREFQTITSMESRNITPGPRIGHAQVLNALAYKEEARDMISSHVAQQPRDKQGNRVAREFAVDEMRELDVGFVSAHSNDGFDDRSIFAEYRHPLTLYTRLLAVMNYRESSQDEVTAKFNRAGLGVEHIFNSDWFLREIVSGGTAEDDKWGSQTNLRYTPTDNWIIDGMYDSFTTDVPLRARATGITSNLTSLGVTYRESEWREYGIGGSVYDFSDGNKRVHYNLRLEQGLLSQNDWRMRLILEGDSGSNSLEGAPYFNPLRDREVSATLMTEQTVWHRYESMKGYYDRGFIHRIYLTVGSYSQQDFDNSSLHSVRYEQEIDFSDTHHLLWGVTAGQHSYDGVGVSNSSIDGLYRWLF